LNPKRPRLVVAIIRPGAVAPGDFAYYAVRITDSAEVGRLAGFFAAYWSAAPSEGGIGAIAEFMIEFGDAAGEQHTMLITPRAAWCMTRRGDWPMHPAFAVNFRSLIA
jgi:hypothetical protein